MIYVICIIYVLYMYYVYIIYVLYIMSILYMYVCSLKCAKYYASMYYVYIIYVCMQFKMCEVYRYKKDGFLEIILMNYVAEITQKMYKKKKNV